MEKSGLGALSRSANCDKIRFLCPTASCPGTRCCGRLIDFRVSFIKRTIEKSGLLTELRAREFYEKPTAERKRKKAAAIKRHYKRLRSMMLPKKLY